jgi:hypothetical protein
MCKNVPVEPARLSDLIAKCTSEDIVWDYEVDHVDNIDLEDDVDPNHYNKVLWSIYFGEHLKSE